MLHLERQAALDELLCQLALPPLTPVTKRFRHSSAHSRCECVPFAETMVSSYYLLLIGITEIKGNPTARLFRARLALP